MRYLDPKADLTFKKVFGEHPDLVISLLNALLPFHKEEEMVQSVEYLPAELVPDNPVRKNSIVDVRCKDARGRQFIVEMQMVWSPEFEQRVLFNASKAYVRQLDKKEDYELLQPVYSLNLVNAIFEPKLPEYYHYYRMVHEMYSDKVIDGLQLIFIELPKFKPHSFSEKKMQVLWLRFLTEIDENVVKAPEELLENEDVNKALSVVEESAFTPAQLLGYDKFWDGIRIEKTLFNSGKREGLAEGIAEGKLEGIAEGIAEGERKKQLEIAKKLKSLGVEIGIIAESSGLSEAEICAL